MIEIIKHPNPNPVSADYLVIVDGEQVDESDAWAQYMAPTDLRSVSRILLVTFKNPIAARKLYSFTVGDLLSLETIVHMNLRIHEEYLVLPFKSCLELSIICNDSAKFQVSADLFPDADEWKEPWSIREFCSEVIRLSTGERL